MNSRLAVFLVAGLAIGGANAASTEAEDGMTVRRFLGGLIRIEDTPPGAADASGTSQGAAMEVPRARSTEELFDAPVEERWPVDVDVAYLALKRTFGFLTTEEHLRSRSINPANTDKTTWLMPPAFRHERLPGVAYEMQQVLSTPALPGEALVRVEAEKTAGGETVVRAYTSRWAVKHFGPAWEQWVEEKLTEARAVAG